MKKIENIILDIIKHGGIGILFLIVLYFVTGFDNGDIMGNSMNPYLSNRDSYSSVKRLVSYNRCDIVIFDGSQYDSSVENANFVKRIIGLPNEKVTIANSKIYINDKLVNEGGFLDISADKNDNQSLVLGNDEYFVLGDNRLYSNDSRSFGVVHKKDLSKVLSKKGTIECLSSYKVITNPSISNTKTILIVSIALLILLLFSVFIAIYKPQLINIPIFNRIITFLFKLLVSTLIVWFTILFTLYLVVRLLWLFELTPVQTNSGKVNESIEDRETEFKKFDQWL